MGGFAIDASPFEENFVPGKPKRLVLTVEGLKLVAAIDPSLIADVSREAIQDKSKASSLAKTIVCLQALWFCVQCITRLAQDLSISLLELNTFVHALCAFLIYALWWHKPLDVEEPLLLQGGELESILAAMVMRDIVSADPKEFTYGFSRGIHHAGKRDREGLGKARIAFAHPFSLSPDDRPVLVPVQPDVSESHSSTIGKVHADPKALQLADFSSSRQQKRRTQKPPDERVDTLQLLKDHHLHGFRVLTEALESGNPRPFVSLWLTPSDVKCIKLASEYMRRTSVMLRSIPTLWATQHEKSTTTPHLVTRAKNWPPLGSWNSSGVHLHSKAILAGFNLAGLVYGIIHLSAWDAPFSPEAQKWLWRASAISLISSPLILVIGLMGDYDADDDSSDFCSMFCSPFSFAFMVIGALCYVTARAYLVVECFISLSHLLADAYLVPHWSRYFPHII